MDILTACMPYIVALLCLAKTVGSLSCYSCVSTEAGCGKELNIRLQRWSTCQSTGSSGGENFCVKVIEKQGSEEFITRDCLMTLEKDTRHRLRIPTVQRHGYCSAARNDDPWNPYNNDMIYCFCNDWNGCNSAKQTKPNLTFVCFLSSLFILLRSFL